MKLNNLHFIITALGLFKGSSLNLTNDIYESRTELSTENLSDTNSQTNDLTSPHLVHSIKSNIQRQHSLLNLNSTSTNIFDFDASKAWEEINNIFETIGSKISVKNKQLSLISSEMDKNEDIQLSLEERGEKSNLQIRKPADLLLATDSELQEGFNSKWCHAASSLIYGYILYNVYVSS